jgi:peroxiredoxin
MRKRWSGLLILASALGLIATTQFTQASELSLGAAAPAFALKNVDGKTVSLKDYVESKGLVVIFSCNSCPYAQAYQDRIIQLAKDYQPKGVPVVVISANDPKKRPDDSPENLAKRAADKNYPFPYLYDETQGVARSYGATNTPHAFVFDNNLKLIYRGRIDDNTEEAKVKKQDVRNALDLLLAGTPAKIETAVTKPFGCTIKWRES